MFSYIRHFYLPALLAGIAWITLGSQLRGQTQQIRYYNGVHYHIINPGESIRLYRYEPMQIKGMAPVKEYYFSKNADSPLLPLSLANFKRAFANDSGYLEKIELYFHSDDELLEYDSYRHQYKINSIFNINYNK